MNEISVKVIFLTCQATTYTFCSQFIISLMNETVKFFHMFYLSKMTTKTLTLKDQGLMLKYVTLMQIFISIWLYLLTVIMLLLSSVSGFTFFVSIMFFDAVTVHSYMTSIAFREPFLLTKVML